MILSGSDKTERSTTSTSAVDGTAITLTTPIEVGTPFLIQFDARKSAGAAAAVTMGLKINSTTVFEAIFPLDFTTPIWTSGTTNEIQIGSGRYDISARDATYSVGVMQGTWFTFNAAGSSEQVAASLAPRLYTAVWPNATITSITPRLISGSASVTIAYKNFFIWAFPTI